MLAQPELYLPIACPPRCVTTERSSTIASSSAANEIFISVNLRASPDSGASRVLAPHTADPAFSTRATLLADPRRTNQRSFYNAR